MMVVSVEIWPGGDMLRRKVIHTINIANISKGLPEISDYEYVIDEGDVEFLSEGHNRNDGALILLHKILDKHVRK